MSLLAIEKELKAARAQVEKLRAGLRALGSCRP